MAAPALPSCDLGAYCAIVNGFSWLLGHAQPVSRPLFTIASPPPAATTPFAVSTGVATPSSDALSVAVPSSPPTLPWLGWDQISYVFAFGDSYTTTHFDIEGAQPSPSNPLGNPSYPGKTVAWGPNWVDFLTLSYNDSYIQTYDFAVPGALVDLDVVNPDFWRVPSFKVQLQDKFSPKYGSKPEFAPWKAENTLFTVFYGINDIDFSWRKRDPNMHKKIFNLYVDYVDQLYAAGARNFLFFNVPPIDRSPKHNSLSHTDNSHIAHLIEDFNKRVSHLASNLTNSYEDATVFSFDFHSVVNQALDSPKAHESTAHIQNTTRYCAGYEYPYGGPYSLKPQCYLPVEEYFWGNPLHITFPVHNLTAQHIAQQLRENDFLQPSSSRPKLVREPG